MYGWRERSPIRYPTSGKLDKVASRSDYDIVKRRSSRSCGDDVLLPVAEYRCQTSRGKPTESLTLRAFSDGLPTAGDLRNFLTTKRSPPKQKQRGVVEHVVRDYRYPQTLHEFTMVRSKGTPEQQPELGLSSHVDGSAIDTLKPDHTDGKVLHSTSIFHKRDVVDGDHDDQQRFKEYVKRRPVTGEDFDPCECGGKGVQVWMRLCGCGCRCARCRAVVRYKRPDGGQNNEDDDDDDPLGWD